MVRRREFKILWLRYIEPPKTHFQGGDLECYGCETLTILVSMVRKRGFKLLWLRYIETPLPKKKFEPTELFLSTS
jgi:hypothetical protein